MSRESQSHDAAVYSASPITRRNFTDKQKRLNNAILGIIAIIYEFVMFCATKAVNASVIVGTALHSKVLIPVAVYGVAIISRIATLLEQFRYRSRCMSHSITVGITHFRRSRFLLAAVLMSLTAVVIASTFLSVGIKIFVDDEPIGYMYSRSDFDEAVSFVEKRASEILERPYSVTSKVRFELGIVPRESVLSKTQLQSIFFSDIEDVSMLYAITVDGQVVGASKNRDTLQAMLDELLHVNDPKIKAHFAQDVQITQRYVDASYLLSYDEIREKLTSKIHSSRTYTVKSGDTINSAAKANGLTRAALIELNPSLQSGRLRAGQKLVVAKEVPFLSVEAVRHVEYTETIPFETKKVESSSLYKGSTRVSVNGKVGIRKVVADVTYVDNKEVSRNIISSTVTREPVTKVIEVGTKPRPKTVATGVMRRPVSGAIISSRYGYRRGSFHSGVDFALAKGNPVVAADGGTVTYAGWKRGGWGYLVIINHGNGRETYYAHNSKVTVSVGQKVAKGEQIAKVGSTGNSSGPHVHFEVHVNGRHVNPFNYIS